MLNFEHAWRFDSPGAAPPELVAAFSELIRRIATQRDRQTILEHFKEYFARASGTTSIWSSSEGWAETDLDTHMRSAAANAPLFIEAFFDACVAIRRRDPQLAVPDVSRMNRDLREHQAGYEIRPPNLVRVTAHQPVPVPEQPASLEVRAQDLIRRSLDESERLLADGRHRQAVQELLWLLETVSTAFQGIDTDRGTVQGKYFNEIVGSLRRHRKGTSLERALSWLTTLHGYLSSPTGGGIRHGTSIRADLATQPHEARLYCNLIRSYISFLMMEHERLSEP